MPRKGRRNRRKDTGMPPYHKLTIEQVKAIRKDGRKPLKLIAYDYGVTIATIWAIINRKCWKNYETYVPKEQLKETENN